MLPPAARLGLLPGSMVLVAPEDRSGGRYLSKLSGHATLCPAPPKLLLEDDFSFPRHPAQARRGANTHKPCGSTTPAPPSRRLPQRSAAQRSAAPPRPAPPRRLQPICAAFRTRCSRRRQAGRGFARRQGRVRARARPLVPVARRHARILAEAATQRQPWRCSAGAAHGGTAAARL